MKNIFARGGIEFLAVFLGIALSLWVDDYREDRELRNRLEDDFAIKVIDFGIAGMAQDKVDAGTLAYMAPECLERVAADTSPAIDVWAIGIMFYCMVYGTLPFIHDNEKELVR